MKSTPVSRKCSVCKHLKPIELFHKDGTRSSGVGYTCKVCKSRYSRKYTTRLYGIDTETYDDLLMKQNGSCAICGSKNGARSLAIDHDHATSKVRGLLCVSCNRGIGCFYDDVGLLRKAIAYWSN